MKSIIITVLMLLLPFLAMAQGQVTHKPTPNPVKPTHKHSVYGPKNCKECNRLRRHTHSVSGPEWCKKCDDLRDEQIERERKEAEAKLLEEQRIAEERKRKAAEEAKLAEQKRIIDNLVDNMVYVNGNDIFFVSGGTQSFGIGKYEVTQVEWKAVMGCNPSKFKGDNLPVESVSWDDCQEFIRKLNTLTGKKFRLPTSIEWVFAARGGNKSRGYIYSGCNNLDSVAWYNGNSGNETHPVGLKKPNELGLYDMSGNVYEWCQDWYNANSRTLQTNPTDTTSNSGRVFHGGSYGSSDGFCISSVFLCGAQDGHASGNGFRLALDVKELEKPDEEQKRIVDKIIKNMVYVENGTFTMGANHHGDYARPAHKVTLASPYYISKYEVTQAEWESIMGSNPSYYKGENLPYYYENGDNLPVENVSWEDCKLFIKKLNIIIGDDIFKLPTEEQWEFAARGGNSSLGYKYSGSNDLNAIAWYEDNSSKHTHPVGRKKSNELGLYDMTGNVYEWCENSFYSYDSRFFTSERRMVRGGAFYENKYYSYVDCRKPYVYDYRYRHIGLRLAAYFHGISGTVVDENSEPLADASISVLNTNDIVVSDANGSFSLESNKIAPMIKVICPGYDDKIIRGSSKMEIRMTPK